jgi:C4-dicarboxylate-specific signal transduction histidine kinase
MPFGLSVAIALAKFSHRLRNFSPLDEAEMKAVDLHRGIDSTLRIWQNRFKGSANKPEVKVIKE